MFVRMSGLELASFILLLICSTGLSAEISVLVRTGDSVQLQIHTQDLPKKFDNLTWINKSQNIVKYITASKAVRVHPSYNNRVDFNAQSFSLILKNMQKSDSGVYTARTTGLWVEEIVSYRVSVIDAVDPPALTVNSVWSVGDSCAVNFTCRAHDLTVHSSFQNSRCSPQEVTSQEFYSLILKCSEEFIFCNHSNRASWKINLVNTTHLCRENVVEYQTIPPFSESVLFIGICVMAVIVFVSLIIFCCCFCCRNKKGVKQCEDPDYDDVESLIQKMAGDTWTTVTYSTVGRK